MILRNTLILRNAVLALSMLIAPMAYADGVMVEDAFARATPPGAKVGAAYMTVRNMGEDTRLVAASAEVAERVELHTHIMDDGVMRMREVEGGIALPAGESVVFEPGGLHIMMIGLTHGLRVGQNVSMTLEFEDGRTQQLLLPIQKIGMRHKNGGHSHHHSHGTN